MKSEKPCLIKLNPTYDNLKSIGIKQLHFHTRNNYSYLRFHRPGKYGDDLTNIRLSVKICNEKKIEVHGFEEGRIYNGFRNVFPLFYNKEHIGSVETSFSFGAIRDQLALINEKKTYFIIKKKVVLEKLFNDELENYLPCSLSENYLYEKKFDQHSPKNDSIMKQICTNVKPFIQDKLNSNRNFSIYQNINGLYYSISFYSIKNISNSPVAYIISYNENSTIESLISRNKIFLLITLTIYPFLILFIGLYIIKNIKTRRLNKQLISSELKLKQTNRELNIAVNTKDKFFSIIAHDLKNPVAGIVGLSKLLDEDFDSFDKEETIEFVSEIHSSSSNLLKLLENLLSWARSQSGKIVYSPQPENLTTLTKPIIDLFKLPAKNKLIELSDHIDGNYTVNVDEYMFNTILRNLISNAIKYTQEGGKIIIAAQKYDDTGFILLSVADNGTGMSEKTRNSIFEIENTISVPGTNNERGTGLGLILCKEFVEKHGGKLWVESEEGRGSKFFFTIPLGTAPDLNL